MDPLILGALALMTVALLAAISQLQNSIRYIEKKLDSIAKQLGIEEKLDEESLSKIHAFLADGKRNKAIKAYRQATGAGLKEAFDAIQQIETKRTSQ